MIQIHQTDSIKLERSLMVIHLAQPYRLASLMMLCSLILIITMTTGCTPAFVKGTEIEYSPERQEVADFIEKYRIALEQRNFDLLKDMVSNNYYENGSTTNDPSDDYDFTGLLKVLQSLKQSVKAIKYTIKINKIDILESSAAVDLEYSGQYLFTQNERDRWETYADKNRLTLAKDKLGHWKIMSGL